jgi:hypothetical protein
MKEMNPYDFHIKHLNNIKLEYKMQVSTERHPVDLADHYQDIKKQKSCLCQKILFE